MAPHPNRNPYPNPNPNHPNPNPNPNQALSGAILAGTITHPMDTIKT